MGAVQGTAARVGRRGCEWLVGACDCSALEAEQGRRETKGKIFGNVLRSDFLLVKFQVLVVTRCGDVVVLSFPLE